MNIRSFRGSRSDDHAVLQSIILFQGSHELSDRASLLSDGAVDTEQLLRLVIALVPALLVQDGIERDSSLASLTCRCKLLITVLETLTIADNQLTLSSPDRNHGVDTLETGLDWLIDRATGKNAGSFDGCTSTFDVLERTFAIDGVAQGIDHAAE